MTKDFTEFKTEFSQYTSDFGEVSDILNEKDIFKNINTIYGVPMCALNIIKSAFIHLLPDAFLSNISEKFKDGQKKALSSSEAAVNNCVLSNSLYVYNAKTGRFEWAEDKDNKDDDDTLGFLGEMSGWLAYVQGAAGQVASMVDGTLAQVEELLNCIGKYLAWESSKEEHDQSSEIFGPLMGLEMKLERDAQFIKDLSEGQELISKELLARQLDPSLQPLIMQAEEMKSPFRLVYGPPKSTTGEFVLSLDGIYYDSQTGGIPFVDTDEHSFMASGDFPSDETEWQLQHYPSLGGKGEIISIESSKQYIDTIFS